MQSGQLQIFMYILAAIKLWVPASSKNPATIKYIEISLVRKQSPVTIAQTHGQKNMIAPSQVIVVPLVYGTIVIQMYKVMTLFVIVACLLSLV